MNEIISTTQLDRVQLAKDIVLGNKCAPGIINRLGRWFTNLMIDREPHRFLPAHIAIDQLTKSGFTANEIQLIRDCAVESGLTASAWIRLMHPEEVPEKYISHMSTTFQVYDLYLNVGDEIRYKFAELMQRLFAIKVKKLASQL